MNDLISKSDIVALLDERIATALQGFVNLPPDAQEAAQARMAGKARCFYTVSEFAAVIGRSPHFVSDRCKARIIRTLRGGKPYRIPLSEEAAWNQVDAA